MKHCGDIEMELAAFCGGELEADDRRRVRAHLEACPDCRAELDRETSLRQTLGSLPVARATGDLDARILAALEPTPMETRWTRPKVRLTAAATLVAAGLAVVLLLPSMRPAVAPEPAWTAEEMDVARQDVKYTLALAARVINRTQKDTVVEVFADRLPNAINDSFKKVKMTTTGGNG